MNAPLARRLLLPVWVVLLSVPIAAAFALTALLFAWMTAVLRMEETPVGRALLLGVLCGLIAWLFVAVFHIRRESLCLPFGDGIAFREHLRTELEEMGYRGPSASGNVVWFTPRRTALLVGGSIRVRWGSGTAAITGPRVFLEILRKRLRMDDHIDSVRKSVAQSWVRRGRHLLKRVEVKLRVPPERWQDVYRDVIEVLVRDGAEVVCEVSILAQSDLGIVKNTVDVVVRDRLRQNHLDANIRAELLHRAEPVPAPPHLLVPSACASPAAG
jgi:hypothetical protein